MKKDEVEELLDARISTEILELDSLTTASTEKGNAVDDLVKLYKLRIEESKFKMECHEKMDARIMENDEKIEARFMERDAAEATKQALLLEQTKDRYLKVGITSAEIVIPLIFYASWMRRGFRFEETGAFTSTTFRGLFNRFKPTIK